MGGEILPVMGTMIANGGGNGNLTTKAFSDLG